MGSKELFLQPILEQNLSVVPGLADNISEMTAQLNETTRIMMNMLSNQGLELHQEAYNSTKFSALSVTGLSGANAMSELAGSVEFLPNGSEWVGREYCYCAEQTAATTTINARISFEHAWKTVDNTESIRIPYGEQFVTVSAVSASAYVNGVGNISLDATLEGSVTVNGKSGKYAKFDFSNISGQLVRIDITFTCSAGSAWRLNLGRVETKDTNADNYVVQDIIYYPKLGFNSANAFTLLPRSGMESGSVATSAKISLPDIVSVGSWATFLLNGNLEGVSLALIDDTSNDLIIVLPAATSDITSVTQMSNLALKVTAYMPTSVINAIAQRYY